MIDVAESIYTHLTDECKPSVFLPPFDRCLLANAHMPTLVLPCLCPQTTPKVAQSMCTRHEWCLHVVYEAACSWVTSLADAHMPHSYMLPLVDAACHWIPSHSTYSHFMFMCAKLCWSNMPYADFSCYILTYHTQIHARLCQCWQPLVDI